MFYVNRFVINPRNRQEALELHFRLKRLFGLNVRNHHPDRLVNHYV